MRKPITELHDGVSRDQPGCAGFACDHGEVVPYAHFFTPSLRVKDVLKEVVEREGEPLTDRQILDRLHKNGIHIARRTVSKYRMALAILPSPLR